MPPKFIKELGGESILKICGTGRNFFGAAPRSFKELGELLKSKHPKADYRIASLAVRMNVPLLGALSDTPWGFSTNSTWAVVDEWLDQPVPAQVNTSALIKKYLAAFDPATPADAQAWSGCKGMLAEFEKLRPQLKVFQNEKVQGLFDLPRAPRPPPNTPAPVRFIPEFDNLILSHADRMRIVDTEHRPALITKNLYVPATFLINGRVAGNWKIERTKKSATLNLRPSPPHQSQGGTRMQGRAAFAFYRARVGLTQNPIQEMTGVDGCGHASSTLRMRSDSSNKRMHRNIYAAPSVG